MAGDMNNNGKVPYPEMENLGSDDDTLTGSGKSSDSNISSSEETCSHNQEDALREVSQELGVVQQPVDVEFGYNGHSSAPPQTPILVITPPYALNFHQMDLYNPAMERYGYSPMQNQEMLQQLSLSSPSSLLYHPYSSPVHVYPPPSQNQVLVQPQSTSYYYPPEPPVYPMQQQNYPYQPSQQVQSPVLQTPPLYQSPQTDLHYMSNYTPCPFGHNVLYPYPTLCPYCFPQSTQQFDPLPQEALQEYYVIQPSAHRSRNRNRQRRSRNNGKRDNCSGSAQSGPHQRDSEQRIYENKSPTNANKENVPSMDQSQDECKKSDNPKLNVVHCSDGPLRDNLNNYNKNASAKTEQVEPVEKQAISVKGLHVSCQTTQSEKTSKEDPLMVESWTQTESPFSIIKFGSVRDIMAEASEQTEVSNTTDSSKMKICSSTRISTPRPTSYAAIVSKTPNPKDDVKTKSTPRSSSANQPRSGTPMEVETSKLIKDKLASTSFKKDTAAKKHTSVNRDTPAKKDARAKKDIPAKKDTTREVPEKKDNLPKKIPIILELTLTRKIDYPALKVIFQRYIFKGMKLDEITNKTFLLIFFNSEDAREVLNNTYNFGDLRTLSEAAPRSKRVAKYFIYGPK